MAPKKTTNKTAPVVTPEPVPEPAPAPAPVPVPVPVPEPAPVPAAPAARKPRAKPAPKESPVVADNNTAIKRNVSAISVDFANTVKGALSFDLNQKQVKEVCETFLQVLVDKVKAGETVSFTNNMTFKRQVRSARTYKNLKTGDTINKPKHFVLTMQVRPALKKVFDDIEVATTAPPTPPQQVGH
jgi:nucleoid DNA-binding protein